MDIQNTTPFAEGLTLGLGPEGKACLAVILKATFRMPGAPDARPEAADEQLPVTTADEFCKDDPASLRLEKDTVPFKPRADVALVGTAYAPGGRPVTKLDVMLRVGRLRKVLRVFGDREWIFPTRMVMVPLISDPESFTRMPLTYGRAFGGIDRKAGRACTRNYAGKGFLGEKTRESVNGKPLPNVEDAAHLISSWNDEPMPAGFGFYAPHCQPRAGYAGTERGLEQPHPLFGMAADFRPDFFNAAHPDLQVSGYLRGDEDVELVNLAPDGSRRFRLPGVRPTMTLLVEETPASSAGTDTRPGAAEEDSRELVATAEPSVRQVELEARLDTLVLLPDEGVFYQVWRGVYALGELSDAEALQEALRRVSAIRMQLDSGRSERQA